MIEQNTPNAGIFSLNEFREKVVLKLAPDTFVVFNNKFGARVVTPSPSSASDYKAAGKSSLHSMQGGVTAITVGHTSSSAGAGTCNISITCPQYEGLHESYYVEQSDGTKLPYFLPLMEVKVFMKGRFMPEKSLAGDLASAKSLTPNSPRYYQVFWGFISGINESYTSGVTSFSLSCRDMLSWWEYMNVNIVSAPVLANWGAVGFTAGVSAFTWLNPWEIILNLVHGTGYDTVIRPEFATNGATPPNVPGYQTSTYDSDKKVTDPGSFATLANSMMEYWNARFNFDKLLPENGKASSAEAALEMFGVLSVLKLDDTTLYTQSTDLAPGFERKEYTPPVTPDKSSPGGKAETAASTTTQAKDSVSSGNEGDGGSRDIILMRQSNAMQAKVSLDFGILNKVLPYSGMLANSGEGVQSIVESKLGIANKVAKDIGFEFYQDTNGNFVFKPPFYNMDTSNTKVYRVMPSDILSFNDAFESSVIVNMMQVTGPRINVGTATKVNAFHADFASMARFGQRYRSVDLPYGNTDEELRALAVSEMAKTNALATTATLEIPLRPELRLGYPIYIDHLDCFYYIKGISHNFNFGTSATTTLTLDSKRSKVRGANGKIMRAFVYRTVESVVAESMGGVLDDALGDTEHMTDDMKAAVNAASKKYLAARDAAGKHAPPVPNGSSKVKGSVEKDQAYSKKMTQLEILYRNNKYTSSSDPGFYVPMRSTPYYNTTKGTAGQNKLQAEFQANSSRTLTELTYFTNNSVPYTDVSGYQHIGAFPFGANLRMTDDMTLVDLTELGGGAVADITNVLRIHPEVATKAVEVAQQSPTTDLPKETPVSQVDTAKTAPSADSGGQVKGKPPIDVYTISGVPGYSERRNILAIGTEKNETVGMAFNKDSGRLENIADTEAWKYFRAMEPPVE